ncbi:hypothetical protein GYMLUDRAFT_57708 [Collybiopsis luxurians FD-317 M1]|uniref:Transcription factor domain-containing protein n=1 Tax=Collybiopsis luxurians FD-317 M1 TaxID=944289 RepID=A0A0D0CTX9_9AGAR|nr:hypothetical protein GYMLUDRAFT_57708 [Collybiopsis luxurians FD-317 M1]
MSSVDSATPRVFSSLSPLDGFKTSPSPFAPDLPRQIMDEIADKFSWMSSSSNEPLSNRFTMSPAALMLDSVYSLPSSPRLPSIAAPAFYSTKSAPVPSSSAMRPRKRNLKVRCEFKTDTDPCKRCLNGGHECVTPVRKKRRTPPLGKREHLLNEIQRQAEEIQKLMASANMPKSYWVEQDPEGSSDSENESESGDQAASQIDGEYELAIVDDEGEEWGPQVSGRQRARSKWLSGLGAGRVSGLKKKEVAAKSVTIPNEAVPFGLIAELSLKQRKHDSSSEAEMDEPKTGTGVANADFFRLDTAREFPTNLPQLPHILARGIITPDDVEKLFKIFFDLVNPSVSIVDPVLYTAQKTVYRSSFLFTTISAISSRFYNGKPNLYVQLMNYAQLAAGTALIGGPKNVEIVATELNLHLPNTAKSHNEMHTREQLNRTRVWLSCFNLDRSTGSQNGKPPIISKDGFIANHSEDWWSSSPHNMKNFDIQLCCQNSELKVMAKFRSRIYSDPSHPTGLNKDVNFVMIAAETDEEFLALQDRWYPILDENVDKGDPPGNFRLGLLKLEFGYARLIVLSYGFQHAFGKNSSDDIPFLERCLKAANDIIQTMVEDIGLPSQRIFIRHGPEAQSVFVAFAAAFLVKLLQPKFATYIDTHQRALIRARVQMVIDFFSSPDIAIDDRHSPKLYACFLKGLLASPAVAEPSNSIKSASNQSGDVSELAGNGPNPGFERPPPATTFSSFSPLPSQSAMTFDQFMPSGGATDPFAPDNNNTALHGSSFDPVLMEFLHSSIPDGEFMRLQSIADPSIRQDVAIPERSSKGTGPCYGSDVFTPNAVRKPMDLSIQTRKILVEEARLRKDSISGHNFQGFWVLRVLARLEKPFRYSRACTSASGSICIDV